MIRSLARLAPDNRVRGEIESARFQLYAAFEAGDRNAATRWACALRLSLLALEHADTRELANRAIDEIERAIDEEE